MILLGTRSSLVVEYEETCRRCDLAIEAAVSFHSSPRLLDMSKSITAAEFDPATAKSGFIPCAFVPATRRSYFERGVSMGMRPAGPLIDPNAVVAASARIDEACFVNAAAVIGALCMIGQGVVINRSASIGHHCILEDFVSIGPGANLASNIRVGEGTVVAAGATILPDVRIGADCVIAAGAVVLTDVPDGAFVAGVPARQKHLDRKTSSLFAEDGE